MIECVRGSQGRNLIGKVLVKKYTNYAIDIHIHESCREHKFANQRQGDFWPSPPRNAENAENAKNYAENAEDSENAERVYHR